VASTASRIPAGSAAALQEPDLLDLVGDIYQAGLEPALWPETLKRISQAFQADLGCIYTPMPARPEQALYLTHNFSDTTQAHYAAYYHRLDAWTLAAQKRDIYIQGLVAFGEELIPQPALHRSEFYQDFLKPHGMEWIVTTALFDGRADPATPATHMTFTRHRDHSAFDTDQARLIDRLAPHVRRALLTHWQLSEVRLLRDAHANALDRLGHGLILLDQDGKVLFMNPRAESLIQQADVLRLQSGRLHTVRPGDQPGLDKLLREATLGQGGGLSLQPTNGHDKGHEGNQLPPNPLRLSALPMREGQQLDAGIPQPLFHRPGALLLIHAPEHAQSPEPVPRFAALHHITPAEQRVLQGLLNDRAPKQIANEQGVSIKTVRTQLSRLYAKTGTRNQRELVKAVLASVI
jgi:DNA-binding CsgD family transcriptional regulator/PAS domain-containing protein